MFIPIYHYFLMCCRAGTLNWVVLNIPILKQVQVKSSKQEPNLEFRELFLNKNATDILIHL